MILVSWPEEYSFFFLDSGEQDSKFYQKIDADAANQKLDYVKENAIAHDHNAVALDHKTSAPFDLII